MTGGAQSRVRRHTERTNGGTDFNIARDVTNLRDPLSVLSRLQRQAASRDHVQSAIVLTRPLALHLPSLAVRRRPSSRKRKPVARRGRKATDQATP